MYQVAQLAKQSEAFRGAVEAGEPFCPLMVKIKLLWECNLACPMCDYSSKGGRTPLAFELVTRLLDELVGLGCRKVHLSGGEPTLRPDLPEVIAYARRLKLRVTLTTNGTLLSRELCKQLVKAELNSLCVSIDSPARAVHDRMRGVPGAFRQTIAGVRELRRTARQRGVHLPIQINTVVGRDNYHTLDRLPQLAASLGAQRLLLIPIDDPSGELLLNKRRLLDYTRRIAPVLAEQGLALGLLRSPRQAFPFGITHQELAESRDGHYAHGLYERQPCYAAWTHAHITADARVAPCCSAPRLTMGDLQQQHLADIWQGQAYRQLRQAMRDGKPLPHCADCDVFISENKLLHQIRCGLPAGLEGQDSTSHETDLGSRR